MARAALWPNHEWIFDSYTSDFISIVTQSMNLRAVIPLTEHALYGAGKNSSHSTSHIGVMPALYYTALKCRVHRVRLQAVRLLEATSHREGLWDAKIMGCVARKVMEIEEGDFYRGSARDDDFKLFRIPSEEDVLLPALPDSRRIQEVEVVLPDDSMGSIILTCKQVQENGNSRVLISEYVLSLQCWLPSAEWKDAFDPCII